MNEEENQMNSSAMETTNVVTHMDILAFINGWDLVSKDGVTVVNELDEEESEDE